MSTFNPQTDTFLTDSTSTLVTVQSSYTYEDYNVLLQNLETLINQLFAEVEAAETVGEAATTLAHTGLDDIQSAVQDIQSDLSALQSHVTQISAQALPTTGGQYTHLVMESFRTGLVRDCNSVYDQQPLTLFEPNSSIFNGCPTRPDLQVDTTSQTLRLNREGLSTVFGATLAHQPIPSLGGEVEIDRIFGTPSKPVTELASTDPWTLTVASRTPLAAGFALADAPYPTWIPSTYQSGGVVRLHTKLSNPSPITNVRLRGATQPQSANTQLLEVVAAVDSRPDPTDPASHPTRPINQDGTFQQGTRYWAPLIGADAPYFEYAPGRPTTNEDRAVLTIGPVLQKVTTLPASNHILLRYRMASPFTPQSGPASGWTNAWNETGDPTPASALAGYVQVSYYASTGAVFGVTTPIDTELFQDPILSQGGYYAGWSEYTHLLSIPTGTSMICLMIGPDPYCLAFPNGSAGNAAVLYSDVWLTDEAITTTSNTNIPQPIESNQIGPSTQGGIGSFVAEESVDNLDVLIGNDTGTLVFSDVWVTIGQECPSIESCANWSVLDQDDHNPDIQLPPYQLSVPTNQDTSRDPILLHQARYIGKGPTEWDAGKFRLSGSEPKDCAQVAKRKSFWNGERQSPRNQGSNYYRLPASTLQSVGRFWNSLPLRKKLRPGLAPIESGLQTKWAALYDLLLNFAKSNQQVPSQMSRVLAQITNVTTTQATGSLYCYTVGLSSLALLREEYADSGLYVTNPLLDTATSSVSGINAEIHEIAVTMQPALPTFNNRLRLWGIPGGNLTGQDTPTSLLSSAIPLDSQNPRMTFHSTAEVQPGVKPANSDIVNLWSTGTVLQQPAFYVTPSFQQDSITGGISPDSVQTGITLSQIPYINQEAIQNVIQTISGYDVPNPNVYDPNAVRPIIDYLTTFNPYVPGSVNTEAQTNTVYAGTPCSVSIPFMDENQALVTPNAGNQCTVTVTTAPSLSTLLGATSFMEITSTGTAYIGTFVGPNILGDYVVTATLTTLIGSTYTCQVKFTVMADVNGENNLVYINGYRPVAVFLQLPSGRWIYPDSLGAPRPGEITYQHNEILQTAIVVNASLQAAASAEYAVSTTAETATSNVTSQTSPTSYATAYSPIAGGSQGMAIDLYWHKSSDFDPASGGINNDLDIRIAPTDYAVDPNTGQIILNAHAPYNWSDYDQVLANYYWVVGNTAVREWFPNPAIGSMQAVSQSNSYINSTGDLTSTADLNNSAQTVALTHLASNYDFHSGSSGWNIIQTNGAGGFGNSTDPSPLTGSTNIPFLPCGNGDSSPHAGLIGNNIPFYGATGSAEYSVTITAAPWKWGGYSSCGLTVQAQVFLLGSSTPAYSDTSVSIPINGISSPGKNSSAWTTLTVPILVGCTLPSIDPTTNLPYTISITVMDATPDTGSENSSHGTQLAQVDITANFDSPVGTCPTGYVAQFSSSNLIKFPTFNGNIDGWFQLSTGSAWERTMYETTVANSIDGTNSLVIPPNATYEVTPTITAVPLQQYTLSYWAFSTGTAQFNTILGVENCATLSSTSIPYLYDETQKGTWKFIQETYLITSAVRMVGAGIVFYFEIENIGPTPILIAHTSVYEGTPTSCLLNPIQPSQTSTVIDVTNGSGAGTTAGVAPSSVSDLFNGPLNQSYPVTRNVTNYTSSAAPAMKLPNFDSTSPNYYPVFEYQILSGGCIQFATDFSTIGPYAGTNMLIQYEYLNINPRIAVEIVPLGQNCFTSPQTYSQDSIYPASQSPEIESLTFLLNAVA